MTEQDVFGKKPAYSATEIAQMLDINVGKVNRYITARLLPHLNIGHRIVRHEDLMEFLEKYVGYDISDPKDVKQI